MRQRVGIAQALVNDPDLVLLDEPTDGVDPVGRRDIRNLVEHLKQRGKTIFLNSHLLSELEMVCDRVAILVQGKVSRQGTLDELTADQRRYEIEVAAEPALAAEAIRPALPAGLADAPAGGALQEGVGSRAGLARRVGARGVLATGESVEIDHAVIRVGTSDPGVVQPLVDALRERGIVIKALRPYRPSLEDLFMQAVIDPTTGEALAPGAAKDAPAGRGKHARKEGGQ
jgi:ABC-2 type transport system ATP-binding protein